MPKEIIMTRYEIADGRTFETFEEAQKEEQNLKIKQQITYWNNIAAGFGEGRPINQKTRRAER